MTPRSSPKAEAEAGAGSNESPQQIIQIVGGTPTGSAVDYMVGLGRSDIDYIFCGGTIIAPGIVLVTAAHCMKAFPDRVFVNLYVKSSYYIWSHPPLE